MKISGVCKKHARKSDQKHTKTENFVYDSRELRKSPCRFCDTNFFYRTYKKHERVKQRSLFTGEKLDELSAKDYILTMNNITV